MVTVIIERNGAVKSLAIYKSHCVVVCIVEKVQRTYGELSGDLHLVDIDRGAGSIGLCLAGNRDLAKMSVFVVGYQPGSVAANDGRIRIGDELLEVSCMESSRRALLSVNRVAPYTCLTS